MAKKRSVRRCVHVPTEPPLSKCPLAEGEIMLPPERRPSKAQVGRVTMNAVSESLPRQDLEGAIQRLLHSGRWPRAKWREVQADVHLLAFCTLGSIKKTVVLEHLGFKRGVCLPLSHFQNKHRKHCSHCQTKR